ncbi:protein Loquacious-like isoform X2 [Battus philenor]
MLLRLDDLGLPVPPPFCRGGAPAFVPERPAGAGAEAAANAGTLASRSYVALLHELCEEYRLPGVQYELTADTGPPHARHFTVSARLGMHERRATSTTKKAARQLAAEQLYTYLKENLSRVTKDFVEDEALARAHAKAMERYVELRDETVWRPHLGQKVADYHLGLRAQLDEEKLSVALSALEALGEREPEHAVATAAAALGLSVEWRALPAAHGELAVLELAATAPPLGFAGRDRRSAACAALRHMRRALAPS